MPALDRGDQPIEPTYFPLVLLISAVAAGIVAGKWLPVSAQLGWGAAVTALVGWLSLWLGGRQSAASWVLLFAVAATGASWHQAYWRLYAADEISRLVREESHPLCVEAIAITSPRWIPAPTPTPLRTIPQEERSE